LKGLSESERGPDDDPDGLPEVGPERRPEYELPVDGRAALFSPVFLFELKPLESDRFAPPLPGLLFSDGLR